MKQKSIKIAPSILSADFGKLNEEVASVAPFADMLHVDIMDGHFVPNITFGAPVVGKLHCPIPIDIHLMIERPQDFLTDFAKAAVQARGGDASDSYLTVHVETCPHLHRVIQQIRLLNMKPAVALNPATPLTTIEHVLGDVDMVLLMTVNPGFGGQNFIESVVPKIATLRAKMPHLTIQVDGGINDKTAPRVIKAGADVLVAGSYIFAKKNRQAAIERLRTSAKRNFIV